MHELAISQSLVSEAERVADTHGAERITALTVLVGPLSGVEAPLLERAFTMARMGTRAADATLHVDVAPVVVWCGECRRESTVRPNALLCEACGTWRVTLRSGDELILKRVELATTEPELAVLH